MIDKNKYGFVFSFSRLYGFCDNLKGLLSTFLLAKKCDIPVKIELFENIGMEKYFVDKYIIPACGKKKMYLQYL